jgi:voltage-dependent calcium channel L type alpha-1C
MMDEKYQDELKKQDIKRIQSPSLFLFTYKSYLRQKCMCVSEHPYYEWGMMVIILFSSFALAIDNPLNDPSTRSSEAFLNIDYVLTGIFVVEVAMKVIGYGFILCGSKSYIRNYWNVLDFLVVSITISSYFTSSDNLNAIKVFKLIKVLRPLRAISKNPGLKISISALAVALPGIFDILIVMLLFFFIFGIITLNYFKGNFNYCDPVGLDSMNMSSIFNLAQSKWDCLNSGALWRNKFNNFDSTPNSMATLFIISNAVQWRETFYTALHARG